MRISRFSTVGSLLALFLALATPSNTHAQTSVGLVASVEEVIDVARRAGIPGVITHVKALGPRVWGFGTVITQRIEAAREEGIEVYTDQYPYAASSTGLGAALLPRWSQAGGNDSLMARFDRPAVMADIRTARRGSWTSPLP